MFPNRNQRPVPFHPQFTTPLVITGFFFDFFPTKTHTLHIDLGRRADLSHICSRGDQPLLQWFFVRKNPCGDIGVEMVKPEGKTKMHVMTCRELYSLTDGVCCFATQLVDLN